MSPISADVTAVALAVLAAWVVPALSMRALASSLEHGKRVLNYRGRPVFVGLGIAWIVWAVSLASVRVLLDLVALLVPAVQDSLFHLYSGVLGVAFTGMPLLLVAFAFAFGLIDDSYGSGADKGFRGHLRALRGGRLTTGALKLFGIGLVAMYYAWSASSRLAEGFAEQDSHTLVRIGAWVLATFVIGLATNLFNLLDLRPGRALKMYTLAMVPLAVAFSARVFAEFAEFAASVSDTVGAVADVSVTEHVAMVLVTLVVLLGPVLAVWSLDLGERGMLGDAGSNVLGAIVGFLLVGILPLWGVAVATAVLLGLNLLSEKVSFSAVIQRVRVLRWLDSLGRLDVRSSVGRHDSADGDDDGSAGVAPKTGGVSPVEEGGITAQREE